MIYGMKQMDALRIGYVFFRVNGKLCFRTKTMHKMRFGVCPVQVDAFHIRRGWETIHIHAKARML